MCMETVGARAGTSTRCPRLTSPDTASVEQYKTRPATGRMTAPERAYMDCRSGWMTGLRAVEPPTYGSPRLAISARILGCSSDPIGMGCIRMQSRPTGKPDVRIDDAGGCRLNCRHCSPGSHVGVDATVGAVPEGKPMSTSDAAFDGTLLVPAAWVGSGMPSRIRYSDLNAGIRTHLTAVRFHRAGSANDFANGTSDASAGRNAEAATHTDVMEMKVSV